MTTQCLSANGWCSAYPTFVEADNWTAEEVERLSRMDREPIIYNRMPARPVSTPLPADGFDMNVPITWEDIEGRLDGKPWPKA